MMTELIKGLAAAFFGTLGFCFLLQIPRRAVLPASILGMLSYLIYLILVRIGMDDTVAIFLSTMFGAFAAQLLARRMRMISTVFVLLSIVPAVPGLGIYRLMELLGKQQYSTGGIVGVQTMITVLAIALGIAAGSLSYTGIERVSRLAKSRHSTKNP